MKLLVVHGRNEMMPSKVLFTLSSHKCVFHIIHNVVCIIGANPFKACFKAL